MKTETETTMTTEYMQELIIRMYGREATTSFLTAVTLAALAAREDTAVIAAAMWIVAVTQAVYGLLAVRARRVWTDMNKETA
jgi:hypothetical protein